MFPTKATKYPIPTHHIIHTKVGENFPKLLEFPTILLQYIKQESPLQKKPKIKLIKFKINFIYFNENKSNVQYDFEYEDCEKKPPNN